MPVVYTVPGVYAISIKDGGASDPGTVSYRFEGHWSLGNAGVTALLTQASSYLANTAFSGNTNQQRVDVNKYIGEWSVNTPDLAAQAASVNTVINNNLAGRA